MEIKERFLSKVEKADDGCWLWRAACYRSGYGCFWGDGRTGRAHRYAYELFVGPIPEGAIIMHTCDVRHCVSPEHLRAGTSLENQQDMTEKGRGRIAHKNGMVIHVKKVGFQKAEEIRQRYSAGEISQQALGAEYGISQKMVSKIVRHLAWST